MANPIPNQLSPGVNISEIDLSQFVQPESLNSAGMVGVFNWGPVLEPVRVNSESNLAYVFGKPTLDQSDTDSEEDFFAASNFLRYSNNLSVVRVLQNDSDSNAATKDVGVDSISNCTHRAIKNFEHFKALGGFSGYDGIEATSHFRARYPGNFGDSLKIQVIDGPTASSDQGNAQRSFEQTIINGWIDYPLWNGYGATVLGVTSGTMGYTFTAIGIGNNDNDGDPVDPDAPIMFGSNASLPGASGGSSTITLGTTGATFNYYLVTVGLPNDKTANQFIAEAPATVRFAYAKGSTSSNFSLTTSGQNPDGNRGNYYILEDHSGLFKSGMDPRPPFSLFNSISNGVFIKESLTARGGSACVDILFLDADQTNMNQAVKIGLTFSGASNTKVPVTKYENFVYSGVPSNFGSLIFNPQYFDQYRFTWSNLNSKLFPSGMAPTTSVKGWAKMVALTGGVTFSDTTTNARVDLGITFSTTSGIAGVRENFRFGITQLVRNGQIDDTEIGVPSNPVSRGSASVNSLKFTTQPSTSSYAEALGGSNDELSIAVIDTAGKFGPKGAVVERFELLSKAVDAKNLDGESIYYKDYINNNSQFIYLTKPLAFTGGGGPSSTSETAFGDIYQTYYEGATAYFRTGQYEQSMDFGQAGVTSTTIGEYRDAYSLFNTDENAVDILFVPESSLANDSSNTEVGTEQVAYEVVNQRKDTILILPTPKPTAIGQVASTTATRAIDFRNNNLSQSVPSNSYTMLVAGRKTFFDTYNNQLRKMSLSSDLAGILAAQEVPWESPAGFARGNLRNVVRLETNFSKQDRDELYKNGINFFLQSNDGSGTVLFGDKTLLKKPSAFDRINVRRVFIAIEKAIAKSAKYSLFEFNDEFTRSQFRNLVNPFLSLLQSQRAIADFKVVCDSTNNTAEVIDKNQFVADIYIKPLKSINFIQLNFIAVRTDFNLTTIE